MKAIWKFELRAGNVSQFDIPRGAKVLTVQTQNETPCIWMLLDPDNASERRYFRIVATGQTISDKDASTAEYIGTFQLEGGSLVFHVFEERLPGGKE